MGRICVCVLLLSWHTLFTKNVNDDLPDAHIYEAGTYLVQEDIPHSIILDKEVHRKGRAVVTYEKTSEVVKYTFEQEIKPKDGSKSYFHEITGETRYFVDGYGKVIAQGQTGRYHVKGVVSREGNSFIIHSDRTSSLQGEIQEVRKIKKTRNGYQLKDYYYNTKNNDWDEYRTVEMIKIK